MNSNFTWSTTVRGEKAIRYNNYLYRFKREKQNGSLIYVCTYKWCARTISVRDNIIIDTNGGKHDHDPKLSENVQSKIYKRRQ